MARKPQCHRQLFACCLAKPSSRCLKLCQGRPSHLHSLGNRRLREIQIFAPRARSTPSVVECEIYDLVRHRGGLKIILSTQCDSPFLNDTYTDCASAHLALSRTITDLSCTLPCKAWWMRFFEFMPSRSAPGAARRALPKATAMFDNHFA